MKTEQILLRGKAAPAGAGAQMSPMERTLQAVGSRLLVAQTILKAGLRRCDVKLIHWPQRTIH
tara:strand:+ start:579 stop:767 length:189 start_codon:yes stop_codon:yes gene_type:complete